MLRNIVGNNGGLGGGCFTIMCNNAPLSVSRTIFFSHASTRPGSNPRGHENMYTFTRPQKRLKYWAGGATTGNIVQYIAQYRGCLLKILLCNKVSK